MSKANDNIKVLVIHVRGNESRREYIQKQVEQIGMPYEYILDGNKEDLTEEILNKYFRGEMHGQYPRTSCAYKHILACKYIIEQNLDGALILEDDIRLFDNFKSKFEQSIQECEYEHAEEPLIINFEESSLMLVPRSKRKREQMLYKADRDRFTGCMYVTQGAASVVLDYAESEKSELAIDRLHSLLISKGLINYYWNHPCLACQCSCDGSMPTMIPTKPRPFKRLKWFYKKFYKRLLYWMR